MREATLDDRRSRAVVLTDAGMERAHAVLGARRSVLREVLACLSPGERDHLTGTLESLLTALTPDRETCDHTCRLCDIASCPQDLCPVEIAAIRAEALAKP